MAKTFDITQAKINAAKEKHVYYRASTGSQLYLTGALAMWKKTPDVVYVPSFRLAGSASELSEVLREKCLLTEAQVAEALADSYASETYDKERFQLEIDECNNYRKGLNKLKPVKEPYDPERAKSLLSDIRSYSLVEKKTLPRENLNKIAGGNRVAPISDQLANLPEGKFLDVSKMRPNGSNIVKCEAPLLNKKTKRFPIGDLRIVSANEECARAALQGLGKTEAEVEAYVAVWKAASEAPVPVAAVEVKKLKGKTAKSPTVPAGRRAAKATAAAEPIKPVEVVASPRAAAPAAKAPAPAPTVPKVATRKRPVSPPKAVVVPVVEAPKEPVAPVAVVARTAGKAKKTAPAPVVEIADPAPPQPAIKKRANFAKIKA